MTWSGHPPLGPGADDEALVAGPGEGAGRMFPAGEVGLPVVPEDGPEAGQNALAGQQITQPKLVGPPLPDELIAHATGTDLALPFAVIVELLLEILTVPAQLLEVLSALFEDRVQAQSGRLVAHAPGPGFARPE